MRRWGSWTANLASALAGAVVGAIVVLGVDGLTRPALEPSPQPSPPPARAPAVPPPVELQPRHTRLLAWSPGGLPTGIARDVRRMRGVAATSLVRAGLDWIVGSHGPGGATIDAPPGDLMIPFETAVVDPVAYARFVPRPDAELVLSLRPGEMLLARTAAELRGGEEGTQIVFADREVTVAGVVSDIATNGYEGLVSGPPPSSWASHDEFMLAELRPQRRAAVERRVRSALGRGRVVRFRARGETPFLRYGDAVLPQMIVKQSFGEFAARPRGDGGLDVDPRWRARNIHSEEVPLLGTITCHRALFPQLRSAMQDLIDSGLDHAIDPSQFAGCYSPRFVGADPTSRLSHHSWGIAFDLNVAENPFGAEPRLDPRVVDKLEKSWGFTWGGRWLIPDGMHFEWVRFP